MDNKDQKNRSELNDTIRIVMILLRRSTFQSVQQARCDRVSEMDVFHRIAGWVIEAVSTKNVVSDHSNGERTILGEKSFRVFRRGKEVVTTVNLTLVVECFLAICKEERVDLSADPFKEAVTNIEMSWRACYNSYVDFLAGKDLSVSEESVVKTGFKKIPLLMITPAILYSKKVSVLLKERCHVTNNAALRLFNEAMEDYSNRQSWYRGMFQGGWNSALLEFATMCTFDFGLMKKGLEHYVCLDFPHINSILRRTKKVGMFEAKSHMRLDEFYVLI